MAQYVWEMSEETYFEAWPLLQEAVGATRRQNWVRLQTLRERLRSLPGFPRQMRSEDTCVFRVRPSRVTLPVSRS